jgi:hypothetical protein
MIGSFFPAPAARERVNNPSKEMEYTCMFMNCIRYTGKNFV